MVLSSVFKSNVSRREGIHILFRDIRSYTILKGGDGVACWSYFVKSSIVACSSQMYLVSATSFLRFEAEPREMFSDHALSNLKQASVMYTAPYFPVVFNVHWYCQRVEAKSSPILQLKKNAFSYFPC